MSDIRHSLLRRDALSAAKEVLYHLDIYFSSQLQSAPVPMVEKGPIELLEEFVFQVPKDRGSHSKVPAAPHCFQPLPLCSDVLSAPAAILKHYIRKMIRQSS